MFKDFGRPFRSPPERIRPGAGLLLAVLIALIAPRPVYVASADEDAWADPGGEFLACVHAEPVYRLFGLTGLGTGTMPAANRPLSDGHIGYHIRTGKHGLTPYDWTCYLDYADRHWRGAGRDPRRPG